MKHLVIEGMISLLYLELVMLFRDFGYLYQLISGIRTRPVATSGPPSIDGICRAIDLACVFYFKHVRCLQRSAATVLLLRRYGWKAELIIGAELVPFRSHAWCEVEGAVVNDRPYMREIYQVLASC